MCVCVVCVVWYVWYGMCVVCVCVSLYVYDVCVLYVLYVLGVLCCMCCMCVVCDVCVSLYHCITVCMYVVVVYQLGYPAVRLPGSMLMSIGLPVRVYSFDDCVLFRVSSTGRTVLPEGTRTVDLRTI